jgi:hypothetical protein
MCEDWSHWTEPEDAPWSHTIEHIDNQCHSYGPDIILIVGATPKNKIYSVKHLLYESWLSG